MQILLVDDERPFARLLAKRLEGAGYHVGTAFTGSEGLEQASATAWDLAVIDVMLPELDGIALTRALRDLGSGIPILMLTARDTVEDRVRGLKTGADDYLVKPFAFAELLARIEALLRRSESRERLAHGAVRLDVPARLAFVGDRPVDLTRKEFDVLECLLRGAGRVVARTELKEYVWDFTFDAPTKIVDLYVHYVRRKLDHAGAPGVIETVRGVGYSIGRGVRGH